MAVYEGLPKEVRQTTQDIAEGVTKAVISASSNKIKGLAKKFLNNELLFIQDEETIALVKAQLKTQEWSLVRKYIREKDYRILIQTGLALRKLDSLNEKRKIDNLRSNIFSKYKIEGLHISQFVQCKLMITYVVKIVENCQTIDELTNELEDMLKNLETRVTFIQAGKKAEEIVSQITARLNSNSPNDYLIFGRDSALELGEEIKEALESKIDDLGYEMETKEAKTSLILVLSKKPQEA